MTAQTRRKKLRHVTIARAPLREPNGRLSRRRDERERREGEREDEVKAVMIEARMRQFSLSREEADTGAAGGPNAGTLHGRMRLAGIRAELGGGTLGPGTLSGPQWQAAEWWVGTRLAYLRALAAPGRSPSETSDRATGTATEDDIARWTRTTIALWDRVRTCLQATSTESRAPVAAAFDLFLVRGEHLAHLEGNFRLGLNAVHRMFLAGR